MKIRAATKDDIKDILRVREITWLNTYVNDELGVTKEVIKKRFQQDPEKDIKKLSIRFNEEKHPSWVAELDNKIVGYTLPFIDERNRKRIGALYVLPGFQGSGIGKKLLNENIKYWSNTDGDVYLMVVEYNVKAIEFYKKNGFRITNDPIEYYEMPGGVKMPEITMSFGFRS